nr:crossover junction endodeoxyribonuclease RuvC [bacterium]
MVILGLDPGLATLGYGVVKREGSRYTYVAHGVVTTPAGVALPRRLDLLYRGVGSLIEQVKPEAIAVEELFFSRNVTTGIAVAQARGVTLLACQQAGVALYEYTPMQVKQAVSGYGHAEKQQVQFMVQRMLGLAKIPRPDDAADALAIALCHGQQGGALNASFKIR